MKKISLLFLIGTIFFLYSCASTPRIIEKPVSIYKADYPLTASYAYSKSTDLRMIIPEGWFTAEDNECNCIDLWLIRNDFSATLNLIKINFIEDGKDKVNKNDLNSVAEYSKLTKKSTFKGQFKLLDKNEDFELNEIRFIAYQYIGDEGLPVRVAVFNYGNQFFEFSALPAQSVGEKLVLPDELFSIQQSVLAKLNYN